MRTHHAVMMMIMPRRHDHRHHHHADHVDATPFVTVMSLMPVAMPPPRHRFYFLSIFAPPSPSDHASSLIIVIVIMPRRCCSSSCIACRRGGRRVHRQNADDAEHSQADRALPRGRRPPGRAAARRCASSADMTKYVAAPSIAAERPQHPAQGQVGARQQIQDEHEPDGGDARAPRASAGGDASGGAATATRRRRRARCTRSAAPGRRPSPRRPRRSANCVPATGHRAVQQERCARCVAADPSVPRSARRRKWGRRRAHRWRSEPARRRRGSSRHRSARGPGSPTARTTRPRRVRGSSPARIRGANRRCHLP